MVIEASRSDIRHVRREGNMVDLFLVTQQSGHGFSRSLRFPQVHGEIVTGGDKLLDDLVVDSSSLFVASFGCCYSLLFLLGHLARVVVVGRAEDKIRREREMIDAMGVCGQRLDQSAVRCVPDFDRSVVRCCVDLPCPAPAHTGH